MSKARTQKRAVVKDQQGKHIYLEHLEDVPEALDQDDLQHDLQQLLRHFCKEDSKQEAQWGAAQFSHQKPHLHSICNVPFR